MAHTETVIKEQEIYQKVLEKFNTFGKFQEIEVFSVLFSDFRQVNQESWCFI